jgi:hypothetical protein
VLDIGVRGRIRRAEVLGVEVQQPLPERAELLHLRHLPSGQPRPACAVGDQRRDVGERVALGESDQYSVNHLHASQLCTVEYLPARAR